MPWIGGLHVLLSGGNLLALVLGSGVGLFIGVLPGLSGIFGLTIFIPLTFNMPAAPSLIFLVSMYTATVFGGAITAILINTPGTPGNIATTFDGYPLAQQGRAGEAIVATGVAGAIGGVLSVVAVIAFAPFVASFGLHINPADYFMLAVFGLSMVSAASRGNTLAGIVLGGLGFLLSMMGTDPISGAPRFDWGIPYFANNGLKFPVMVIGLFAISNAFIMLVDARHRKQVSVNTSHMSKGIRRGLSAVVHHPVAVLRSSVLGIVLGAIPGIGISIANIVAYVMESRLNRKGGFGQGNIAGPMVAEAADNGTMPAELIPTFTLGIPGGATSALMLEAVTIHGLEPGISFFHGSDTTAAFFIGMLVSQVVFAVLGILLSKVLAQAIKIPATVLAPIIIVLSCVGAYAIGSSAGDIVLALVFGVVGYFLLRFNYPLAPLVLGTILGPLAESNYRRAMLIQSATHQPVFLHPVPIILGLVSIAVFTVPLYRQFIKSRKSPSMPTASF